MSNERSLQCDRYDELWHKAYRHPGLSVEPLDRKHTAGVPTGSYCLCSHAHLCVCGVHEDTCEYFRCRRMCHLDLTLRKGRCLEDELRGATSEINVSAVIKAKVLFYCVCTIPFCRIYVAQGKPMLFRVETAGTTTSLLGRLFFFFVHCICSCVSGLNCTGEWGSTLRRVCEILFALASTITALHVCSV